MRKLDLKQNWIPALVIVVAVLLFLWVAASLLFTASAYAEEPQPVAKDPFSYERYECPFTENPQDKGCFPPPDVKCTDMTYTNCEYVGSKVSEPIPEIQTPPAASHAVESKPTVVSCSEI